MGKPVKVAAVLVLPSSFPVHLAQRLSSDVAPQAAEAKEAREEPPMCRLETQ
ncbi:hypothetical protein [Streptomyces canus]|uniref:hypothetical protein n=1 Tax=Streptomyces canus TaxID=58343 RepID=UPI00324C9990